MPQKIIKMKQLVNLPRSPENQEYALMSCNAELQLKHHGEGELALLQHLRCFSCGALPGRSVQAGAVRVSHLATGWHFPTRNPAWLQPGKPLSTVCLEKSSSLKASVANLPGKAVPCGRVKVRKVRALPFSLEPRNP